MEKFTDILNENKPFDPNQTVEISGIKTTKGEISKLNQIVANYIKSVYASNGYKAYSGNIDINVDGLVINTEYLDKMVNNYTIYSKFIRLKNFTELNDLRDFISANLDKIYKPSGYYFKEVMTILSRTIAIGNTGEKLALATFADEFNNKLKVSINIESPSIEDDLKGIDGKFEYIDKSYTIQVKPMESFEVSTTPEHVNDYVVVTIKGSLSLSTDYLVMYDITTRNVLIARNRQVEILGTTFKIPLSSIVNTDSLNQAII